MAVSGDRFMVSAWNGFLLNLKHCMKFAFANFLAKCFIFMGKFCVVVVNVGSVYLFLRYVTGDYQEIQAIAVGPFFIMFLITWIISSIFLNIFDDIVLALMTCLAIDVDLHGDPKYGPPGFHDFASEYDPLVK